jgi:hypothetical protein
MCGAVPPLPQYVFMVSCVVKHRDNFNLEYLISREDIWSEFRGTHGKWHPTMRLIFPKLGKIFLAQNSQLLQISVSIHRQ